MCNIKSQIESYISQKKEFILTLNVYADNKILCYPQFTKIGLCGVSTWSGFNSERYHYPFKDIKSVHVSI